jgi:hypothetical protein
VSISGGTISGASITGGTISSSAVSITGGTISGVSSLGVMGDITQNGKLLFSATAPTISSGFGAGASIIGTNPAAFQIVIAAVGVFNGVILLPVSSLGWFCHVNPYSVPIGSWTIQNASGTNYAGLMNVGITGGNVVFWVPPTVLDVSCFPR